jgi:hypothetical protein
MPTIFMNGEDHESTSADDRVATSGEVLEPEVLESLDAVDRPGSWGPHGAPGARGPQGPRGAQMHVRPVGCTLGPGCGCIGLPLLALAGVLVSSVIALLWVLSLGRLPISLMQLAARARRGFKG